MASKKKRGFGWTQSRRGGASSSQQVNYEQLGIELSAFSRAPQPIAKSDFVFDMDSREERVRCISQLWKPGGLHEAVGSLAAANEELALTLLTCTANKYKPVDAEAYANLRCLRLDATLADLVRDRNQKHVPLLTVACSVAGLKNQLHSAQWLMMQGLHRGLYMSQQWTEALVDEAVDMRPPSDEPLIDEIGFTVFDNYTRRVSRAARGALGEADARS